MASVSVIVVSYNAADELEACLRSLAALPEVIADPALAQVIVSDNGSADDSVARARAAYPGVVIIENGANLGFAKACNIGARSAAAPLLFFFNPDARAKPGLLANAVAYLDAHADVAMCGCKVLNEDGTAAESCGEFDTWWQAFLRSSALGELPVFARQANGYALRRWDYASERDVDLVIGAAMFIRKAVFEKLGGFDERFFLYHERSILRTACATPACASSTCRNASSSMGARRAARRRRGEQRAFWAGVSAAVVSTGSNATAIFGTTRFAPRWSEGMWSQWR